MTGHTAQGRKRKGEKKKKNRAYKRKKEWIDKTQRQMIKVKLNRGNTQKPHTVTLRKRKEEGKKEYKEEPKKGEQSNHKQTNK